MSFFSYHAMFFTLLIISTLLVMSSTSWLTAWMTLEINLIAFIPLIAISSRLSAEAAIKYFFIQTIASIILLLSILFFFTNLTFIYKLFLQNSFKSALSLSLLFKMGAAPFHFWVPQLMEGLSWNNSFILMTWQKLAPLTLLLILNKSKIIFLSSVLSLLMGAIGGLNILLLRKMLSFSSINHLGWMIMMIPFSLKLTMFYFSMYILLMTPIMLLFFPNNIYHLSQLYNNHMMNWKTMFLFTMSILSLMGLPPFLGFIPKWLIISFMMHHQLIMISIIMMMSTLIALIFYIRMTYSYFLLTFLNKSWSFYPKSFNQIMLTTMMFSLMVSPFNTSSIFFKF